MNKTNLKSSFFMAVRFLTVFPLGKEEVEVPDARAFTFSFPLIGLGIGFLLWLFAQLFHSLFPPFLLAGLLVLLYLILTRMLHLDGLMDTADGFLAAKGKEEALRIMKEPQVGSFGVIACVVLLLLYWGAFAHLISQSAFHSTSLEALLAACCAARWAMLLVATFSRPAKATGLGAWFCATQSRENLLLSSFLPLVVMVGVFQWFGVALFVGVAFVAWVFKKWSERSIGGVTGDVLGAVLEITQLFVLLAACLYFA